MRTYSLIAWISTFAFLQNMIMIKLTGGQYDILTQKFQFGPEDFLAYIGGYLVCTMNNAFLEVVTTIILSV